jgi:hypothetical protein
MTSSQTASNTQIGLRLVKVYNPFIETHTIVTIVVDGDGQIVEGQRARQQLTTERG